MIYTSIVVATNANYDITALAPIPLLCGPRENPTPHAMPSCSMAGSGTDEELTIDRRLRCTMKSQQRPASLSEFHRTILFYGHWL